MSPFIDTAIDDALTDDATRPGELSAHAPDGEDWMYEDDKREYEYDRELITARMG